MLRSSLKGHWVLALALTVAGCASTHGARTVAPSRFDYSEALARSWNEQMLLNLVRLRYRDTPQFLQVSSVVTQFSYNAGAAAGAGASSSSGEETLSLGGSVGYTESPTISYEPMLGKAFAERFLTPVATETLMLLSQSGWSISRLMRCCVHQINDLRNAPSAAGPTPDYEPPHREEFQDVAAKMRALQKAGLIEVSAREVQARDLNDEPRFDGDNNPIVETVLYLRIGDDSCDSLLGRLGLSTKPTKPPEPSEPLKPTMEERDRIFGLLHQITKEERDALGGLLGMDWLLGMDLETGEPMKPSKEERARLLRLLGMDSESRPPPKPTVPPPGCELSGQVLDRKPNEIALVGRSLMATLFFLSQAVEPPAEHEKIELVTPWPWEELTHDLLSIKSQKNMPADAFVKVRYRGYWFWIEDTDRHSKTTFGLLNLLFALQSEPSGRSPLLTLSAGG